MTPISTNISPSFQLTELNTFFLKHIFEMPPSHPVVIGRLVFVGLFTAPSVRQYYIYVTDTRCKRLGTQCWVYIAILISEAILCIKNGRELFERTQVKNIVFWLFIQAVISIMFVYSCMLWHKYVDVSLNRVCGARDYGCDSSKSSSFRVMTRRIPPQ